MNFQIVDFLILDFLFFKIRKIGLFSSQITIFILEISLKYIYIQNMDEIFTVVAYPEVSSDIPWVAA